MKFTESWLIASAWRNTGDVFGVPRYYGNVVTSLCSRAPTRPERNNGLASLVKAPPVICKKWREVATWSILDQVVGSEHLDRVIGSRLAASSDITLQANV
ncbi:hypothetical protein CBL_04550 [Carabus blaptoides fortunei]